jgi:hypothetical protein
MGGVDYFSLRRFKMDLLDVEEGRVHSQRQTEYIAGAIRKSSGERIDWRSAEAERRQDTASARRELYINEMGESLRGGVFGGFHLAEPHLRIPCMVTLKYGLEQEEF